MASDQAEQTAQTLRTATAPNIGVTKDNIDPRLLWVDSIGGDQPACNDKAITPLERWLAAPQEDDPRQFWIPAYTDVRVDTDLRGVGAQYGTTFSLRNRFSRPNTPPSRPPKGQELPPHFEDTVLDDFELVVPEDFEAVHENTSISGAKILAPIYPAQDLSHDGRQAPRTPQPSLRCDVPGCTYPGQFSRKRDLRRHVNTQHGPKSPCPMKHCDYSSNRTDNLREHLRRQHEAEMDELYVCRAYGCNYGPGLLQSIRAHAAQQHPAMQMPLISLLKFRNLEEMVHSLTASSDFGFDRSPVEQQLPPTVEASSIPEGWSLVLDAKGLEVVEAPGRGENQSASALNVCPDCGRGFTARPALLRHQRFRHGDYERLKFACHLCSLRFNWAKDLSRHMGTHDRRQEYKCAHCDSKFTRQDNLRRHTMKEHESV